MHSDQSKTFPFKGLKPLVLAPNAEALRVPSRRQRAFASSRLAQPSATTSVRLVRISISPPPPSTLCTSLQESPFQIDIFHFLQVIVSCLFLPGMWVYFFLAMLPKAFSCSHTLLHNLLVLFLFLSHNCSNNIKYFQIQKLNP